MDYIIRDLELIFSKKDFSIEQFCILLHEENLNSALETLSEFLKENFEGFIKDKYFSQNYLLCLSTLVNKAETEEDRLALIRHTNIIGSLAMNYCKAYNKREKRKDALLYASRSIKTNSDRLCDFLTNKIIHSDKKYEKYRIMEFIIFKLMNPDYLFRILQVNPELVNVRSIENKHLFTVVSETLLNNYKKLPDDKKMYYKRIIMLMLESDELSLKNKEIIDLLDLCKKIDKNNKDSDVKFFVNAITEHYPTLNGSDRLTCVDYTLMNSPSIIIESKDIVDGRVDLTNLFTISIDGNRNSNLNNVLFDDAFSLQRDSNGIVHVLIHIPDVDLYIPGDSELDKHMRRLGQSVYAYGFRKPLIDFEVASMMSLKQGAVRPTITFDIAMDDDSNIKGISFYKSLVKVNYNLSKDKADQFIKFGSNDDRLSMLNKMLDLMTKSARKRKEKTGGKSGGKIIMEEVNILPDLVTAQYVLDSGIPFAFKNYLGRRKVGSASNVRDVDSFIRSEDLDEESSALVKSIFDIYNRVFYDTINIGNASFHNAPCVSVGNPLREYISLESDRLIKDLLIDETGEYDYWKDRIERDVIEYTEKSAKLQELYGLKKGR